MGVDYTYFSAATDAEAGATVDRVIGPSSQEVFGPPSAEPRRGWWRRRRAPEPTIVPDPSLPVFDNVELRGIDPVVQVGTLEALLTGRAYEDVLDDDRSGRVVAEDESTVVVTLTDSVRDALASADRPELDRVAQAWFQTEEFETYDREDRENVAALLVDIAALARRARAAGLHLYCWANA